MSSVPAIDLRRALAIVQRMKAENVELAEDTYNATVQFMGSHGFSAQEDQWLERMKELVNAAHTQYSSTTIRSLSFATQFVDSKGGFAVLHEKLGAAITMESEIGYTFDAILDLFKDHASELSPQQLAIFDETFNVVHRDLLRAKDAELVVLEFLRGNHGAIRFLQYAFENFQEVTFPLRIVHPQAMRRYARQALDIVDDLLDEAITLLWENADAAASAATHLRSYGDQQIGQDVFDQEVVGLLNTRNKLIELRASTTMHFDRFFARLQYPDTLPTTLQGPPDVEFTISTLLNVAAQFARMHRLLDTTHQFGDAQTMINSLLQATSWSV
ncbi:hypothetical protein FKP32DRAFT_1671629 [Trametes sanguinea]|nr:hypothetical protein FKP32DRAFT_1671629 [Trametes sanguinea]